MYQHNFWSGKKRVHPVSNVPNQSLECLVKYPVKGLGLPVSSLYFPLFYSKNFERASIRLLLDWSALSCAVR